MRRGSCRPAAARASSWRRLPKPRNNARSAVHAEQVVRDVDLRRKAAAHHAQHEARRDAAHVEVGDVLELERIGDVEGEVAARDQEELPGAQRGAGERSGDERDAPGPARRDPVRARRRWAESASPDGGDRPRRRRGRSWCRPRRRADRTRRTRPRARQSSSGSKTSLANTTGASTKTFFTHWCGRTVLTMPARRQKNVALGARLTLRRAAPPRTLGRLAVTSPSVPSPLAGRRFGRGSLSFRGSSGGGASGGGLDLPSRRTLPQARHRRSAPANSTNLAFGRLPVEVISPPCYRRSPTWTSLTAGTDRSASIWPRAGSRRSPLPCWAMRRPRTISRARARFRDAVAERYECARDEVVPTLGASGALFVAHATLLEPGSASWSSPRATSRSGAARSVVGSEHGPLRASLRRGLRRSSRT